MMGALEERKVRGWGRECKVRIENLEEWWFGVCFVGVALSWALI